MPEWGAICQCGKRTVSIIADETSTVNLHSSATLVCRNCGKTQPIVKLS